MQVLKGGPVDTGRGFVLHSSDFFIKDATLQIDDGICLTATVDILKAIAKGTGPEARDPGAGLCRLGAGAAGDRNPGQWLAALRRRSGSDLRRRRRGKISARAAQDRDRSGHAVERSRARVATVVPATAASSAPAHNHRLKIRIVLFAQRQLLYAARRPYSAACCATVGAVPATVARRMSRGCD